MIQTLAIVSLHSSRTKTEANAAAEVAGIALSTIETSQMATELHASSSLRGCCAPPQPPQPRLMPVEVLQVLTAAVAAAYTCYFILAGSIRC